MTSRCQAGHSHLAVDMLLAPQQRRSRPRPAVALAPRGRLAPGGCVQRQGPPRPCRRPARRCRSWASLKCVAAEKARSQEKKGDVFESVRSPERCSAGRARLASATQLLQTTEGAQSPRKTAGAVSGTRLLPAAGRTRSRRRPARGQRRRLSSDPDLVASALLVHFFLGSELSLSRDRAVEFGPVALARRQMLACPCRAEHAVECGTEDGSSPQEEAAATRNARVSVTCAP